MGRDVTMKFLFVVPLIALFVTSFSEKSYANDIFLKCLSLTSFGDAWKGNVSYIKIYPIKGEALFQDTGETTSSWEVHNINSINDEQIWIAPCRTAECTTDNNGNKRIDRVTGILSMVSKQDGKWHEMASWQCQRANVF